MIDTNELRKAIVHCEVRVLDTPHPPWTQLVIDAAKEHEAALLKAQANKTPLRQWIEANQEHKLGCTYKPEYR